MTEYERSRTLPALPELVFDQVADPGLADRWLPHELHLRPESPPAVTVHEDDDRGGHDVAALFRAEPDQMRVEWGTRADGHYAGWLQVAGIGSGASEVTVHLSFFDEEHAPDRETVSRALDESLDRLGEQVGMRTQDTG
ncbi:SRPBCC family protein [Streptomyces thermolineatus]|uniref:SRPBCC family protein n=1 Tax=Streptomyces thermolineatus TaxID=44033 RepID=A0ABP5Y5Q4_9ACTN